MFPSHPKGLSSREGSEVLHFREELTPKPTAQAAVVLSVCLSEEVGLSAEGRHQAGPSGARFRPAQSVTDSCLIQVPLGQTAGPGVTSGLPSHIPRQHLNLTGMSLTYV